MKYKYLSELRITIYQNVQYHIMSLRYLVVFRLFRVSYKNWKNIMWLKIHLISYTNASFKYADFVTNLLKFIVRFLLAFCFMLISWLDSGRIVVIKHSIICMTVFGFFSILLLLTTCCITIVKESKILPSDLFSGDFCKVLQYWMVETIVVGTYGCRSSVDIIREQ